MELDKALLLRIRRYLLTGIIVIAPVGVTVFVLWWIFARLDQILGRIFAAVGVRVPGLGLLALLVIVIGVGWVAQQAIGGQLINVGRNLLMRFPLTKSIYGAASQLTEQIVGEKKRFFKACVLVEYPRPGCWVVGFLTSEGSAEINGLTSRETVAVFIPTTPNPTSGYLAFVPRSDSQLLRMSVEDGFKLVISGGAVTPELAGTPVIVEVEADDGQ